jgi:hypothetical protein
MGTGASMHHNCYVQQTAGILGVDVLNMGQGGACMCEPELADFFANLEGWDFAPLVNVGSPDAYSCYEDFRHLGCFLGFVQGSPGRDNRQKRLCHVKV